MYLNITMNFMERGRMNKILLILFFFLIPKIGFTETLGQKAYPNDVRSQKIVDEQSWQTASNIKQELAIRNKASFDEELTYQVIFIVTNIDTGDEYTKKEIVMGNQFRSVIFPDDFSTIINPIYESSGNFKWVGIVDDKIKVWGSFSSYVFD